MRISEPASLGREVATIPGVRELRAANGIEAAGLSDTDRRLLFKCGIRGAGSHEGDNTRENVIDLVNGSKTKPIDQRGLGCALRKHIVTEADRK